MAIGPVLRGHSNRDRSGRTCRPSRARIDSPFAARSARPRGITGRSIISRIATDKACRWSWNGARLSPGPARNPPEKQVRPKSQPESEALPVSNLPKGRYVYAWFKDGEILPFYIGKGADRRAWQRHTIGGRTAYCQRLRDSASTFQVKIIKDNLTDEGASLVESVLMSFLVDTCGVILSNQSEPVIRRAQGCLTIESALEAIRVASY